MAVNIVKVARPKQKVWSGRPTLAILAGMLVTSRHLLGNLLRFVGGKQDFTVHYPEQRFVAAPALRGMPVLVQMETGKERCVACGLCEWACPTDCITIFPAETADEVERYPAVFDIK